MARRTAMPSVHIVYLSQTRSPLILEIEINRSFRANPLPAIASNNVGVPMLPSATGPLLYAPRQTDRRRAKRIPISRVRRLTVREFTPIQSHSLECGGDDSE
jgi:hypothetical protein